jgi:hypothetical protein
MSDDEYSYEGDKSDVSDIEDHVNEVRKTRSRMIRGLHESNPHEQAIKYNRIKENPPDKDFMKVEAFRGKDEEGRDKIFSRSIDFNGETRWIESDPFFVFSPFIGFQANIAKASVHAMDMLLDEAMNMVSEEKKAFKPEKRSEQKQLGWILLVVLSIIGSIAGGGFLLMRMMG